MRAVPGARLVPFQNNSRPRKRLVRPSDMARWRRRRPCARRERERERERALFHCGANMVSMITANDVQRAPASRWIGSGGPRISVRFNYLCGGGGRPVGTGDRPVQVRLCSAANDRRLLYCADRRIDGCGRWRAGSAVSGAARNFWW